MDISSYLIRAGTAMSGAQTGYAVGLAVTKKIMDTQELQAQALLELMATAPSFGHTMDIRV